MPVQIKRIWMQRDSRLDSKGSLFLIQETRAGRTQYPGAAEAEICEWEQGSSLPEGKTWQQHLEEGTLLIGVGGGPFDEHANEEFGDGKAKGYSATFLTAKHLGIHESLLFRQLVRAITQSDLAPVNDSLNIAIAVKEFHRYGHLFGMTSRDVLNWVFIRFQVMLAKQAEFIKAGEEYRKTKRTWKLEVQDEQTVSIAFVESDNVEMWAAARYRDKTLAVLVQQRQSGHVQIFGNENLGVNLEEVVRAIRVAELGARNQDSVALAKYEKLHAPGQLPEVPMWYFQTQGQLLLNGSETAPSVQPTAQRIDRIIEIIRAHVKIVRSLPQADSGSSHTAAA